MIADDELLLEVATEVGEKLLARNMFLATAESCTGGWVSKVITDVEGSSGWFECALVTYHNEAKRTLLGVDEQTLKDYGAVSQPTVKAMVLGLLDRCNASIAVSISGVAGPGGGTDEKPVGTVWMAWARPGRVLEAVRYQFDGDREQVRRQAVYQALLGVKRLLDNG